MRIGQVVKFTVDGGQRPYSATVTASEQNVSADTRDLRMRAVVNDKSSDLVSGRFAEVALTLTSRPQAIMIPTECIIPQAKDKKVVVSRNGKAKFTTITTGVRQSDKIEVLSGLVAGDTIVTSGMLFLKPEADFKFTVVK